MRTMAVVFLALLVGTAVILLPLQDAQEEMSRPAYTVGVVLKAMDSEHWLCGLACRRPPRRITSA